MGYGASNEAAAAIAKGEMDSLYVSDTSANNYVKAQNARAIDRAAVARVPQRDVRVGADGDRALARVEAEDAGGVRRGHVHELVE